MRVDNADESPTTEWAKYLREVAGRSEWSVARLAREADIDRTSIFRWLKGGGDRVTIELVRRIADATGDDLDKVLRAAAGLPDRDETNDEDEIDFEIRMIEQADLPPKQKEAMISYAREVQRKQQAARAQLREQQRADRRAQLQAMLDVARGGTTRPAT